MKFEQYRHYKHAELIGLLDQERVWRSLLGSFQLDKYILNPLRNDRHVGSCKLVEKDGIIKLMDYAAKEYSGLDCIAFYMKQNPTIKWNEVCINLLSNNSLPVSSYRVFPGIVKEEVKFTPFYKQWDQRDIDFWALRGLEHNPKINPVSGYIQQNGDRKREIHTSEQVYAYECNGRFKFYYPNRESFRFIGNMQRNDLWHKKGNSTLLITKSHKDFLVLEDMVPYSLTHIQGENWGHPDGHILLEWELLYDTILVWFDGDIPGIEGANRLASRFAYKKPFIFFIDPKYEVKDIDQFRVEYGYEDTIEFLNNNL
jgi:hypothetical protein